MLRCRPNTIWSLPTGEVNFALPTVPREHTVQVGDSRAAFDNGNLRDYAQYNIEKGAQEAVQANADSRTED